MSGRAAFVDAKGAKFTVRDAPEWPIEDDEVKIKVHAVAINPVDHHIVDLGMFAKEWPAIVGADCAGTVVEVGAGVTGFKVGDRVGASTGGPLNARGNKCGAFQDYVVVEAVKAFKVPDHVSFDNATVFPSAVCAAALGLFAKDRLALAYPQVSKPTPNGKIVLIWGGSSSVGACAVQLAAHAGYEVFATSGKQNFEMVKSLGASQVFDYKDADVIKNIVAAIKGREKDYVGAFSATQEGRGVPPAVQVAEQLGLKDSFVATTNPMVPQEGLPAGVKVGGNIVTQVFAAVELFGPAGPSFPAIKEIGDAVFASWLPEALAANTIKISPPAKVVGHGLGTLEEALDLSRKGAVSGVKLVVTL